jgi:hypothetical protein
VLLVGRKFCTNVVDGLKHHSLHIRNQDLESEINDLGRNRKVNDLFCQAIGIDIELLRRERLSSGGEPLCSDLENVQVGDENPTEGNVDKRREENAKVGRYEVEDEDLLYEGGFVGFEIVRNATLPDMLMDTYRLQSHSSQDL